MKLKFYYLENNKIKSTSEPLEYEKKTGLAELVQLTNYQSVSATSIRRLIKEELKKSKNN